MKNHGWEVLVVVCFLAGCLPQSQSTVITKTLFEATPTVLTTAIPSPTPAGPEVVVTHPELEVISPENIGRLEQIASWGEGKIYDYAVSPDRSMIAVSTVRGIYLFDSQTLREFLFISRSNIWSTGPLYQINFSPDSQYLLYETRSLIVIYDIANREIVSSLVNMIPGFQVKELQLSYDTQNLIVTASGKSYVCDGSSQNIALYHFENEEWAQVYNKYICTPTLSHARFTSEGKAFFFYQYIDTNYPYQYDVLDLKSKEVQSVVYDDGKTVNQFVYDVSPDGKTFAVYLNNPVSEPVELIDSKSGKSIAKVDQVILFSERIGETTIARMEFLRNEDILFDGRCQIVTRSEGTYEWVRTDGAQSVFMIMDEYHNPVTMEIWNTDTCERLKADRLTGGDQTTFTPDGSLLAVLNGFDLDVWDVATGKIRYTVGLTGDSFRLPASEFMFSGDGKYLIAGTYMPYDWRKELFSFEIFIWDAKTGQHIRTIMTSGGKLDKIVANPHNNLIALVNQVDTQVWDTETGIRKTTTPSGEPYITADGEGLWLARDDSLTLFDLSTGEKMKRIPLNGTEVSPLVVNPDETRAAFQIQTKDDQREMLVVDLTSGDEIIRYQIDRGYGDYVLAGKLFLKTMFDGSIDIYDYENEEPVGNILGLAGVYSIMDSSLWGGKENDSRMSQGGLISHLSLTPNKKCLLAEYDHNKIRIWNMENEQLIGELSTNYNINTIGERSISYSPDGRLIVITGWDGIIRLWGVKAQNK